MNSLPTRDHLIPIQKEKKKLNNLSAIAFKTEEEEW